MEIDFALFAQRMAFLAMASGFVGAALWHLLVGSMHVLAHRLHSRAARRERIAQARARALGNA